MAKTLTPKDAHVIMTELCRSVTAQKSIAVVDTSSFVSAGELILAQPMENIFNAFNILMGRVYWAARRYNATLNKMDAIGTGEFTHRFMKTSYYSLDPMASGWFNTDAYTNLADGFTNGQNKDGNGDAQSTKSMWEQMQRPFKSFNFGGSDVWDFGVTMYENQFKQALRSEAEFLGFIDAYMTEHANDLETQREAWNRMVLLTKIAQTYDMSSDMPGSVKNLTYLFNQKFSTNYTSAQLRTTYLKEFLEFMVAEIKADQGYLEERSANFHYSAPITYRGVTHKILRHTPKADQYVYLYSRLFKDAEAMVLPEIFHDDDLRLSNYQEITYWQSNENEAARSKIKITPPVIDTDSSHTSTVGTQIQGSTVQLDYVVGMICDRDGMLTDFQIERADTTPLEARKGYRNTWMHIAKNAICDPTENTIIYYMADPTPGPVSSFADPNSRSLEDLVNDLEAEAKNIKAEAEDESHPKKSTKSSK